MWYGTPEFSSLELADLDNISPELADDDILFTRNSRKVKFECCHR